MNAAANGKAARHGSSRRTARLAAVQALYEIDVAGASVDLVLLEFLKKRWDCAMGEGDAPLSKPDENLLSHLVRGTAERSRELDAFIKPVLSGSISMDRMESLLKTILRTAAFELTDPEGDVSAPIIISEYVDIAHAFYSANETALVNGVLDRLAHEARPGETLKGDKYSKA